MDFKTLHLGDLPELLSLQNMVYEDLEDKEVLQTLTEREFKEIIAQGFIIGAVDDGHLVASRSMYVPTPDEEEHLADEVGLKDKEKVIYSEISFIASSYRGSGLQTSMGRHLIEMVKADGRFHDVLTTVMPENVPSLKDKFRLGFKIRKTTYKYNGKKRHVMHLHLWEPYVRSGEATRIHYTDTDWMLEHGADYVGNDFDGEYISYYRK
ncbi:GNAT family N-acetyltransferase [Salinicoccus roseus]|uniref:GNAT family N-acetyltransferase n=1 Tax=Salinicoccus roseus TaxID=45670 RepID=UPI001EF4F4F5|nr:N-acetyltransferase [Salinicoccus roseus]MCG7332229.1 N-acetyltransferase [Salinicoccus roseus]